MEILVPIIYKVSGCSWVPAELYQLGAGSFEVFCTWHGNDFSKIVPSREEADKAVLTFVSACLMAEQSVPKGQTPFTDHGLMIVPAMEAVESAMRAAQTPESRTQSTIMMITDGDDNSPPLSREQTEEIRRLYENAYQGF